MFNNYTDNRFNFNVNAVSGTLRKSHPKSKFCVRRLDSDLLIFSDEKIVLLQIMLIGNDRALIEYVPKVYWEEKTQGENNL